MSDKGEVICGTAEVERIAEKIRSKQNARTMQRRLPIGAELAPTGGAHFRVWAPATKRAFVALFANPEAISPGLIVPMIAEAGGYFSAFIGDARPGTLYKFQLDSGTFPDPASRFQPNGPHGPSAVVDSAAFNWTDSQWRGVSKAGQAIYEMHVATFTPEGTWRAAMEHLEELKDLGITMIEVMPIADFPGRFGWGYDGVNLFAPTRLYGTPDDCRAFVDRAHSLELGVILDVVYNHIGPDGNYLSQFSPHYFSKSYECEWGDAINFDDEHSRPVREFFIANARYWIEEFHFDGLRLDATQQIFDASEDHIMAAICREVRQAAGGRGTFIVGENETQCTRLVRPAEKGGYGLDALWNDDLHHSAVVAATGRAEAYYTDYRGTPQEFISAVKWGYLYQGQWYKWQKQRRGTPALDLEPTNFVSFLENHDQVANSARGRRVHQLTSPGRFRALTAFLLLGPATPMLFQGQEFASSAPYHYFADHHPELSKLVAAGRRKFMHQFKSAACPDCDALIPDPSSREVVDRCVLDWSEREKNSEVLQLHRDLLRLRREDPVFSKVRPRGVDGAVLAAEAFVLRFFGESEDRLMVVNLGPDLNLNPAPEPLLAPPADSKWESLFSTESVCFGGSGTPALESEENWWLPGHAAVVLAPKPLDK